MMELAFGIHQRPQAKAAEIQTQRVQAQYCHDENRAKTLVLSNVAMDIFFKNRCYRWLISRTFPYEPQEFSDFVWCLSHTFPHVQHRFFAASESQRQLRGIRGPRYHPDDPNIILSGGWDNTAAWIDSISGFWGDLSWDFMGFFMGISND